MPGCSAVSGAAITAVGKSVGLTTMSSGHSGLPMVPGGLTGIDTAENPGEVGPRASTERLRTRNPFLALFGHKRSG